MRFIYPAQLEHYSDDEIVVSFRDVPFCHTSGTTIEEALLEAEGALAEGIAACILNREPVPEPSAPLRGDNLVQLPIDLSAKAALVMALNASPMSRASLAEALGVSYTVVSRMLDPRHRTAHNRINAALRILGQEMVLDVHAIASDHARTSA